MKKLYVLLTLLLSNYFYAQRAEVIRAENYFRNGSYEKALTLYKNFVKISPYNVTYLKRLVSCYQETNNYKQAEDFLINKLKSNTGLIHLNVLLGDNFERQKNTIESKKYYEKALKEIDKYEGYATTVASLFRDINKLDYAIEAYKKINVKSKGAYGFQIAQLYGEKGEFKQMFESYINYLNNNDGYLNTVKRYTSRYISDDPEDENNIMFKKVLLRSSASNPKNEWNNLLAWLFTNQKDYFKAFVQLKAIYTRGKENLFEIKQLGKIAFDNKDYKVAKMCFDFIIQNSDFPQDKFQAISNNLDISVITNQKDVELKFKNVFTEFGINYNTFPVQLSYANYLTFTKNNPEKAKEILETALKFARINVQKADVKLKLGEILVYQNKFNEALIYFSQVQTQFKNHELGQQARFKVAQTSYFKNDFKWAKAQLKVLKGSATQLIANDAADLFLTISDNQPKDSISNGLDKFAKASLLAYQNKDEQSIALLTEVITKFKGQPIEDEALFKQAKLFIKNNKPDLAIVNLEKIINETKKSVLIDDSLFLLGNLYFEKNEIEKAKTYYQKIVFEHQSSIYLVDARKQYRKLRGDDIK